MTLNTTLLTQFFIRLNSELTQYCPMVVSSYKDIGVYCKNVMSHKLKVNISANKRFLMLCPQSNVVTLL